MREERKQGRTNRNDISKRRQKGNRKENKEEQIKLYEKEETERT